MLIDLILAFFCFGIHIIKLIKLLKGHIKYKGFYMRVDNVNGRWKEFDWS